jgi:integrase
MGEAAIRFQIEKRTTDAFGRHVWPHVFRAIAATGFVDHAPEAVALVPDLLGHASTQTAHRHYILSKGTISHKAVQSSLMKRREAAAARLGNADRPIARRTRR